MEKNVSLPSLVQIQRTNIKINSKLVSLKYLNPVYEDRNITMKKLANAPHLRGLLKLFDNEIHERIVIITDDLNSGIGAAGQVGKCMVPQLEESSTLETNIFEDDEEDNIEWGDYYSDEGYIDSEEENAPDETKDNFVIVLESKFDPSCNHISEPLSTEQLNFKGAQIDYSDFENLVFVSDGLFALTEKSIDFLQGFNGRVVVIIPEDKKNSSAIEQLSFESDFDVVHITKPTVQFLAKQFKGLVAAKGYTISKKVNIENLIKKLVQFRGQKFQEYDLFLYLEKSIKLNKADLTKNIDTFPSLKNNSEEIGGQKLMDSIVGLDVIKESLLKMLYKNIYVRQMSEKGNDYFPSYKHIAFEGNPGTGKTTMARAIARLYLEHGILTNGFYEYGRENIVGRYLGETSQKVSRIFKMARGGVIFIDEIGSLLNGDSIDSYAKEALDAIIRHMENDPETMVIIATYPREMEKIISINPGLKSRLSSILRFPDYSNEELVAIFTHFAAKGGYFLENGYEKIIIDYFDKIRSNSDFGNGREARKLFEKSIEELASDLFKNKSKDIDRLTSRAIRNAISILTKTTEDTRKPTIGFAFK